MELLRVVVINGVDGARRNLKNMLIRHGFRIIAEAEDAISGLQIISSATPDLIVIEDTTRGWQEIALYAYANGIAPVLLIVSQEDSVIGFEAASIGITGIIVRPLTERNLATLAKHAAMVPWSISISPS